MRLNPSLAAILAAAHLGMAQRMLELFVQQIKPSAQLYTGESNAEKIETRVRIAEADAEINAAELIVRDIVARFEDMMASGIVADAPVRARTKWQAAYAAQLCRRAPERLFSAAGARVTHDSSELQRFY